MIKVGDIFRGTYYKRETYFPWPENNTFIEEGELEIKVVSIEKTEKGMLVRFEIDPDEDIQLENEYEFTVEDGELVYQKKGFDGVGGMEEVINITSNELEYFIEGEDGDKEDEERVTATKVKKVK